ncbi:MAG: diguanylate cyclase [Methylococcaceae bacterium]|nr:diguanylate cyclase [Methylococcaceae bacterium]
MNTSNPNDLSYWKNRYFGVRADWEQYKKEVQDSEKMLFQVIARLSASVLGLDPSIDNELLRVRELAKQGELTQGLRDELDRLAEQLFCRVRESRAKGQQSQLNVKPVFSFLYAYLDEDAERSSLAELQAKAETGEFPDEAALFGALEKSLKSIADARAAQHREPKSLRSRLLNRLFGKDARTEPLSELEQIKKNLQTLLGIVDIPLGLQAESNHLQEQLARDLDALRLLALFEEVLEFLVRIRSRVQVEQQSLEVFLTDLNSALEELGRRALGMQARHEESEQNAMRFHRGVSRHMENLRSSSSKATEIGQLKHVINDQLATIASWLTKERETQMEQTVQARREVEQLSGRLHELEFETGELRSKLRIEHALAMRDALTGLPNRNAYDEFIAREVARSKRFGQPFCLLIWDIDFFKSINDRFGHKAGDKALMVIAELLAASIRETDFVGRFGGEEFVMVLSGSRSEEALKVADGIRRKVENCGFNSQGKPVNITISCGITQFADGDNLDDAFERADRALYRAKGEGRNRCVVAAEGGGQGHPHAELPELHR